MRAMKSTKVITIVLAAGVLSLAGGCSSFHTSAPVAQCKIDRRCGVGDSLGLAMVNNWTYQVAKAEAIRDGRSFATVLEPGE